MICRTLGATAVALLLAVALAPVAVARTTKVNICHYDSSSATYAPISISDNGAAVAAHLAHGDAYPGDPVPAAPGYVFDAACLPVWSAPVSLDTDGDGIPDRSDNCPSVANLSQPDRYGSARGDACEDTDGDTVLDVDEADICVSVDGVVILMPVGSSADCLSLPSTGTKPNIAVANGDSAYADAEGGDNNAATAIGLLAVAFAGAGNDNTATATGDNAFASASAPDGCTVTNGICT